MRMTHTEVNQTQDCTFQWSATEIEWPFWGCRACIGFYTLTIKYILLHLSTTRKKNNTVSSRGTVSLISLVSIGGGSGGGSGGGRGSTSQEEGALLNKSTLTLWRCSLYRDVLHRTWCATLLMLCHPIPSAHRKQSWVFTLLIGISLLFNSLWKCLLCCEVIKSLVLLSQLSYNKHIYWPGGGGTHL